MTPIEITLTIITCLLFVAIAAAIYFGIPEIAKVGWIFSSPKKEQVSYVVTGDDTFERPIPNFLHHVIIRDRTKEEKDEKKTKGDSEKITGKLMVVHKSSPAATEFANKHPDEFEYLNPESLFGLGYWFIGFPPYWKVKGIEILPQKFVPTPEQSKLDTKDLMRKVEPRTEMGLQRKPSRDILITKIELKNGGKIDIAVTVLLRLVYLETPVFTLDERFYSLIEDVVSSAFNAEFNQITYNDLTAGGVKLSVKSPIFQAVEKTLREDRDISEKFGFEIDELILVKYDLSSGQEALDKARNQLAIEEMNAEGVKKKADGKAYEIKALAKANAERLRLMKEQIGEEATGEAEIKKSLPEHLTTYVEGHKTPSGPERNIGFNVQVDGNEKSSESKKKGEE